MRADDVASTFRSFVQGDRDEGINRVRTIIAKEKLAGRDAVASKLEYAIAGASRLVQLANAPPEIELFEPVRSIESLVLDAAVAAEVQEFAAERRVQDDLRDAGIEPRSVAFFHGEPGNGKTALCEALATELGLPFGVVDYSSVIDSHLGETAKGVSRVFKWLSTHDCVLLFDECDSIVSQRVSPRSGSESESNRTVNQVLRGIDGLGSRSVVVFATNFGEIVDPALDRRIGLTLELPKPTSIQLESLAERLETRWPFLRETRDEWRTTALSQKSFAKCENVITQAARRFIVAAA